ncbi:hypothetical protein BT69DRAFT_890224 [Atractiella rhizophila]|nr:hypothetical protein BT69DRAFT_890224 [Atractiella rhizophila]
MTTSRKTRASTSNIPYDPEDHTESFGEPHSLRSRRASTSKLVSYKEELAEEEPHASEDSDTSSSLKHRPTMPKRVTRIRVNSISRTPSKPGPKARRKKNSMLPLPKTLDLKEPSNVCAFCLGPVKVIYHDKKNRVTTYGDGAMGCPKCFTSAHVDCEGFMTEETYAETQKYEWVCQNCKTCEICNTNQGKKGEAFICDYCDRQWDEDCLREKYNQIPNADPDILWKCPKCNPDHPSSSTAQTPMDLNGSKRKRVSFNVPSNASGEPPNKKQKTSSLGKEDQLLEAAMQQVVNQPKISLKFKPRPRTSLPTFDQTPKRKEECTRKRDR